MAASYSPKWSCMAFCTTPNSADSSADRRLAGCLAIQSSCRMMQGCHWHIHASRLCDLHLLNWLAVLPSLHTSSMSRYLFLNLMGVPDKRQSAEST